MAAMDLDGHLAETHLESDLLVEIAGDHEAHDFPFARRQGIEARLELRGERVLLASSAVAFNSGLYCVEHFLLVERLGQEFNCAGFHSPHRNRDITMATDENHRKLYIELVQCLLKLQTAPSRQSE